MSLTDLFGAFTQQSLLLGGDGAKLYGWSFLNSNKASIADVDVTNANELTIGCANSNSWADSYTLTAPFLYKPVTGNFHVDIYASDNQAATEQGFGLLAMSPSTNSFIGIGRVYDTTTPRLVLISTVSGSASVSYVSLTYSYLRLVRVGNVFYTYARIASSSSWSLQSTTTRNDLPSTIWLGVFAQNRSGDSPSEIAKFSYFQDETDFTVPANLTLAVAQGIGIGTGTKSSANNKATAQGVAKATFSSTAYVSPYPVIYPPINIKALAMAGGVALPGYVAPNYHGTNYPIATSTGVAYGKAGRGIAPPVTAAIATAVGKTLWINIGYPGDSYLWYSQIGEINFDLDQKSGNNKPQEAGQSLLSWRGYIYKILKLDGKMIVLGAEGVSEMTPHGVLWGEKRIYPKGLMGKGAVCQGKDSIYFIDNEGFYCELDSDGMKIIDYSFWLFNLSSTVLMFVDPRTGNVYACDGTIGFVISKDGIGKGPNNITGMGVSFAAFMVCGAGTIVTAPAYFSTEIRDFNTRDEKWISSFDIVTNVTQDLYGAISYRWNKAQGFFTTPWVKADYQGHVNVGAAGVEFIFNGKQLTYSAMDINEIRAHVLLPNVREAEA